MLGAANDHDVPGFYVDGDDTVIVDELHLTGPRPEKVGLVPVIDVPGPEVLELLPCRGRVHGDFAASLPLSFLQSESEQMIRYVFLIGGVELHTKVGQSL